MTFWNRYSDQIRVDFDDSEELEEGATDERSMQLTNEEENQKNSDGGKNGYQMDSYAIALNKLGESRVSSVTDCTSDITPTPKKPLWKIVLYFVCGIENIDDVKASEQQIKKGQTRKEKMAEIRECLSSIIESNGMSLICAANAILLMAASIFIWGFYR